MKSVVFALRVINMERSLLNSIVHIYFIEIVLNCGFLEAMLAHFVGKESFFIDIYFISLLLILVIP